MKFAYIVLLSMILPVLSEAQVVINEILTTNYGSITNFYDEDGDSPDFIELHNTTNSSVNLSNWILVDGDGIWKFPVGTSIAANGYLSVWASGKDRSTGQLHTNFKLDSDGEYLGLYDDQNNLVFDFGVQYPPQYNKLSYGINSADQFNYFDTPTMNNANGSGYMEKIAVPVATLGRGFYDAAVVDTLNCSTPNATIRYTLDGTPVNSSSPIYTGSININPPTEGLATIRARAYLNGYLPSDEVSWSYVFPEAMFSGNVLAVEGIRDLPVISIQNDDQILQSCIVYNPCDPKAAFVEWLELDSLGNNIEGFSEYAGVNLFGESSLGTKKRNFRIHFDVNYNNKHLEYPIFEDYEVNNSSPTDKFRKLDLKGGYFDSYERDRSYETGHYITENWWRSTVLAAGGHSMHSRFVHLFVNGESRGIYTLRERFDHNNYAEYTDADIADINAIRFSDRPNLLAFDVQNGDSVVWQTIKASTNYDDVKHLINPASFLAQSVMESLWDFHFESEFRVVGTDNNPSAPYQIINNDLDFTFSNYQWHHQWMPSGPIHGVPMINNWKNNPEFIQDAYEFTAKIFCNNGAMSEQEAANRLNEWASEISAAMHTEVEQFAGNYFPTYYDHTTWQTRINDAVAKLNNLDSLYNGWVAEGLYNGCDLRPVVSIENQISPVNNPVNYAVEAYDPDGDAMTFTSSTLPPGLSVNAATGEISGTPTQIGTFDVVLRVEDTNGKWGNHYFIWEITNIPPLPTGIVLNEIMYHPDSLCVGLPTDADMAGYIELKNTSAQSLDLSRSGFTDGLDFQFPQGAIIAPGGFYVIAENATVFELVYGFAPDAMYKDGLSNDGERLELSDAYGNIIDSLTYNDVNPWDEDPDGNAPSLELLNPLADNADPINWFRSDNFCGTPGTENSRVCTSVADQIIINEINYNSNNGVTDPGDWVELYNPNTNAVDISDWSFYDNTNEFIFPAGTIIQPDQYLVLVEDDAMFTDIFPHLTANDYIGNFSFGLSNKGERISLFNKDKCLSDYVIYNDRIPWDTIPDGNGPTLSLITLDSDNVLPESWEASSYINSAYGTPGRANTPCPENALWLPDPICAGFPAEIKVDSAYSNMDYTWFASGATPFNFTTDSETLTWNNSGNYNLQLITKYYECTKVYTQTVSVTDCNTIPGIIDDNFTVNEDNVLPNNVLTNDNDPDNNNLNINTSPINNVSNGTLVINPDGTFDYSPNPNFNGTDSFTYQVCDDASVMTTVPQNFVTQVASGADDVEELSTNGSINVTSSDLDILEDPPSIFSAIGIRMTNIAIPQGAAITGAYLEFVADESQNVATSIDISAEAVGNALAIPTTPYSVSSKPRTSATTSWANIPAWGKGNTYKTADIGNLVQEIINRSDWTSGNAMTFILEGTGTRTAESFEGDVAPKLVITYGSPTPTDISLCDEATVIINVTPENDPPQAVDNSLTIPEDTPAASNLLTNDSDIDGDNLTANTSPITPPQNGSLTIQPYGLYSYTPNPDFFGTDMFEYEVCDDGNPVMCDTASVTVNVTPVNDTPVTMPDTLIIFANSTIQHNVLLNDSDIENHNLTAMIVPMVVPANGSVTIQANGSINYTPNPNFVGTDSFTYEVCDDGSPVMCSTGTVVIIIEPDCVDIELYAWLEGAYDPALGEMRNTLVSSRKLLPGQTPVSNLATPTPAGQPYSGSPWNYAGTEGAAWTDADYTGNETDWVLASFRTGTAKSTEVGMTAGLLMKDGSIDFPDRCALTSTVASPLYIVLEHRNHIGIMTPQPVDVIGSTLTYDFRLSDSFRDPTSFGQKLLPTGEWTMFAGDADQSDFPSFDIQGTDKTIWFDNNGIFDYYFSPDFNLDGDINGQDKSLWFENNGISSRVPK